MWSFWNQILGGKNWSYHWVMTNFHFLCCMFDLKTTEKHNYAVSGQVGKLLMENARLALESDSMRSRAAVIQARSAGFLFFLPDSSFLHVWWNTKLTSKQKIQSDPMWHVWFIDTHLNVWLCALPVTWLRQTEHRSRQDFVHRWHFSLLYRCRGPPPHHTNIPFPLVAHSGRRWQRFFFLALSDSLWAIKDHWLSLKLEQANSLLGRVGFKDPLLWKSCT